MGSAWTRNQCHRAASLRNTDSDNELVSCDYAEQKLGRLPYKAKLPNPTSQVLVQLKTVSESLAQLERLVLTATLLLALLKMKKYEISSRFIF